MKYFVENLPSGCCYCDCCHTKDYDWTKQIDGDKFCGIEDLDVTDRYWEFENPERPDWCPLREIPKQKSTNWASEDYEFGYDAGWNDCIDKMLNE